MTVVTASAIRRFATALRQDAEMFAPPTFAIVPALEAVRELDLGLDDSRVVHRAQSFRHRRTICAGDVLDTRAVLRDVRNLHGNKIARVDVTICDRRGHVVCTATTTLAERDPKRLPTARPTMGTGQAIEITRDDLVRYAHAAGDLNPIHLDPEAAKQAGLPGVIAHGMLTMGLALTAPVTACEAVFLHPVVVDEPPARLLVIGSGTELTLSHHGLTAAVIRTAAHLTTERSHP